MSAPAPRRGVRSFGGRGRGGGTDAPAPRAASRAAGLPERAGGAAA